MIKYVFRKLSDLILNKYKNISYSQEGEDLILNRIFEYKPTGFYIDVGAHHPKRFSNTFIFYEKGWNGINLDAMPGSMTLFNKLRKRDINIECGIGIASKKLDYYIFNEPALNGFSKELSEYRSTNSKQYKIQSIKKVNIERLDTILEKYLPDTVKEIDFLSIDVEGLDFEVLISNNWKKYRPTFVIVEILESGLVEIMKSKTYEFMIENNYTFFAKTVNSVFFKSMDTN
jgi:FkbM family methyltransferase